MEKQLSTISILLSLIVFIVGLFGLSSNLDEPLGGGFSKACPQNNVSICCQDRSMDLLEHCSLDITACVSGRPGLDCCPGYTSFLELEHAGILAGILVILDAFAAATSHGKYSKRLLFKILSWILTVMALGGRCYLHGQLLQHTPPFLQEEEDPLNCFSDTTAEARYMVYVAFQNQFRAQFLLQLALQSAQVVIDTIHEVLLCLKARQQVDAAPEEEELPQTDQLA
eukprot:m.69250 g.69250  ORF g.69250 m.69250 type:complete len:226 (+) comp14111_c0_seq1:1333-2010(+)